MKLTLDEIQSIALGIEYAEEENEAVKLHRFTREQEAWYKETNEDFYERALTPAGVKLSFETDSESLFLKVFTRPATGRRFFSIDVFVDDKMTDNLINFGGMEIPEKYSGVPGVFAPGTGEFSKSFSLGKGEKHVCIHLPWSVRTDILEFSLDDGAYIKPVKPQNKLLAFGDSITQGYDALYPSDRYIARLAEALDAEEFNKAIGGEKFCPGLAALPDGIEPDYITVAYGINDWTLVREETFIKNCREFFFNLTEKYPDVKIFAITPIWISAINEERNGWYYPNIDKNIREITKAFKNVTVLSGMEFVPGDVKYFADQYVHPNDEGFELYFRSLYNEIKKHI